MPELPEVETTRKGIAPLITGRQVAQLILRTGRLRWPLDASLCEILPGQVVHSVTRRAKCQVSVAPLRPGNAAASPGHVR